MPANLTPEYEKAELRFRQSATDPERIEALLAMLAAIPKHKGTEKLQADLKRRLSQLRKSDQKSAQHKGPDPFHIPKTGAGQVVVVGPPNTGKSSLLATTTHAEVRIAEYPFTTTLPVPGMWQREAVSVELVDTPPLTADHVPPGLMGTVRNSDLVGVLVEAGELALNQAEETLAVLHDRGVELVSAPPDETPAGAQPGLILANKIDLAGAGSVTELAALYAERPAGRLEVAGFSARTGEGLDTMFALLWRLLGRIRVYAKEPGKPPDLHKPFVLPAGATLRDLALQIHRDLPERMKFARLWGHSRFPGQSVHKTEVLRDGDVVEIHE